MTDSQSGHPRPRSAGGVQTVAAFRARRLAERAALRQRLARPTQQAAALPDPLPAEATPEPAAPPQALLPEAMTAEVAAAEAMSAPSAPAEPEPCAVSELSLPEPSGPEASLAAPAALPLPDAESEAAPSVFSTLLDEMQAPAPSDLPSEMGLDAPPHAQTEPEPGPEPEPTPKPSSPAVSPISETPGPAAEAVSRPVLGLGPGMRMRLQQLGYSTIDDLAHADPAHLREALGEISRLIDIDAWIASARRMRG